MSKQFPLLSELVSFINERWNVHERRHAGRSAPWTRDPILQTYRFTNVRREDDRVTKWIAANWIIPHQHDADLWFAAYVARIFNKPETLAKLPFPLPWGNSWKRRRMEEICQEIKDTKHPIFNGAYIVSTHRVKMPKVEYYGQIFDSLWKHRAAIRPTRGDSLASFFERLSTQDGIGGFMGAQVLADIKWHTPLLRAVDWETFARSGPGSRRGLNWVSGREVRAVWREPEWHDQLLALRGYVLPKLPLELQSLDCQNLQNCLCEYSKYCKVKYDGRRAKQYFRPSKEDY